MVLFKKLEVNNLINICCIFSFIHSVLFTIHISHVSSINGFLIVPVYYPAAVIWWSVECLRHGESWFDFLQRKVIVLFFEGTSPAVADLTPPSNAEVKNAWSSNSAPPRPIFFHHTLGQFTCTL